MNSLILAAKLDGLIEDDSEYIICGPFAVEDIARLLGFVPMIGWRPRGIAGEYGGCLVVVRGDRHPSSIAVIDRVGYRELMGQSPAEARAWEWGN